MVATFFWMVAEINWLVVPQPLHTILYSINQERLKNGEIEQHF